MDQKIIITTEVLEEICGHVRIGASFIIAAMAAGLTEMDAKTAWRLMILSDDEFFKEFRNDYKRACAHFEVMQLMKINAEGGARGAMWLLERSKNNTEEDCAPGLPANNNTAEGLTQQIEDLLMDE